MSKRLRASIGALTALLTVTACGAWPGAESPTGPNGKDDKPVTIRYQVKGIKQARVFYYDDKGEYVSNEVSLPWQVELRFADVDKAALISVVADQPTIVEPHMGALACTIAIDGEVVANDEDVPASAAEDRHVECGFTRGGDDQ